MPQGKVLVAQGGGPTAVINQSMAGVVLEARKFRNVELVYGAYHGVSGILKEEFLDLTRETSHNIEMVASTPSSALGSTRDKPDLKYCHEIFEVLRAHGIGYFFYFGAYPRPRLDQQRRAFEPRDGPNGQDGRALGKPIRTGIERRPGRDRSRRDLAHHLSDGRGSSGVRQAGFRALVVGLEGGHPGRRDCGDRGARRILAVHQSAKKGQGSSQFPSSASQLALRRQR